MTPATPNPILAVETHGHATPLRVAADRAGWDWLDAPTPRELLRAVFLRSHAVVVLGLGPSQDAGDADCNAGLLLKALHSSSQTARVLATSVNADDATEHRARQSGVSLYLNNATPQQLITAARTLLPEGRIAASPAPVHDKHPTPADPALAPRAHLARLLAHPPPARDGPTSRSA